MFDREYTGVSFLLTDYFRALLALEFHRGRNLRHGRDYEIVAEDNLLRETFIIRVSSREAYDLMQKVFEAANR